MICFRVGVARQYWQSHLALQCVSSIRPFENWGAVEVRRLPDGNDNSASIVQLVGNVFTNCTGSQTGVGGNAFYAILRVHARCPERPANCSAKWRRPPLRRPTQTTLTKPFRQFASRKWGNVQARGSDRRNCTFGGPASSSSTRPPWASATARTMASPRPLPPTLVRVVTNRRKSCSRTRPMTSP